MKSKSESNLNREIFLISKLKIFASISILIISYYIIYGAYLGITHPIPAPGDSFDYHIPIEHSILNGTFLTLPHAKMSQWYYPSSSEVFNALFILFHIPLTLSNLVAVVILYFVCFRFALIFKLNYYFALIFSSAVCALNVFVRWYNAVSIDVWLVIFFLLSIILLEQPRKTYKYFFSLGLTLGIVLGSKDSGLFYVPLLLLLYWKNLLSIFSITGSIFFFIPFSIFGLFWYIRNYFLKFNPFYPLPVFGLHGSSILNDPIWHELISQPATVFNALYGEYNLWLVLIFLTIIFSIYQGLFFKKNNMNGFRRLYFIGLLNFLLFFFSPTSPQPWIIVSSIRYTFTAFIPLILCSFILATYYKKELLLSFIAIANMLCVLSMIYYPKLTLIYLPLAFLCIFIAEKLEKKYLPDKGKNIVIPKLFH